MWIVEHEFDDEPTFVVLANQANASDEDENCVKIGTDIPISTRLPLARLIAKTLNES